MAKTKRVSRAEKHQQEIDAAVERALAKRGPGPAPAVDPSEAEKRAKAVAAVHEAARIVRRGEGPADVVDFLTSKANELEKA